MPAAEGSGHKDGGPASENLQGDPNKLPIRDSELARFVAMAEREMEKKEQNLQSNEAL